MHALAYKYDDENLLDISVSGTLTSDDYDALIPELEREIRLEDDVKILFDMTDLEGIGPEAVWKDLKFDVEHRDDFERVAVVGDSRWHQWATQLFKPIPEGDVRYFDEDERDKAITWLRHLSESEESN